MTTPKQKSPPPIPQLSNLLHLKLDFSLIQDTLTNTLKDIYSRISHIESQTVLHSQKSQKQFSKIYQLIQTNNQTHNHTLSQIQQKLKNINIGCIVQKTPKQMLDHIENRLQINLKNQKQKDLDVNISPPQTDRLVQTFRVKENIIQNNNKNGQQVLDRKVYEFYEKTVQKIQEQITKLRKDFKNQINQISFKSRKLIQDLENNIHALENKDQAQPTSTLKNIDNKIHQKTDNITYKYSKNFIISSHNVGKTQNNIEPEPSQGQDEDSGCSPLQKIQIKEFLQELKKEVKQELQEVVKNAQNKFEEINRTNSVLADHLVQTKKTIEDLTNDKDTQKLQLSSIRQKLSTTQRQIYLLVDSNNETKQKYKNLQTNIQKLTDQLYELRQSTNETIKQQANQDDNENKGSSSNSSRKEMRDSHSSFRSSSGVNGLGPLRNNSVLKLNNNKIQGIQEMVRNMNGKVVAVVERINRMEDQRKRHDSQIFNSTLPKIQKQNRSSLTPTQLLKRQLKHLNEQLQKTNQKLSQTKSQLTQLYESHRQIPQILQQIHKKLHQKNQLQQDRLIQLIKQLINRVLTDPFDNNFTNRLKRQINVKFLEIKHQYHCILKEIEGKVENRAEIGELGKLGNKIEEGVLEVKAICNRKCDTEDFKKGIKYLENKIKEVFQFARSETVALANQQKQYIGAKKQQLHA